MQAEGKEVSISALCRWFGYSRSSFYYQPQKRRTVQLDEDLSQRIYQIMERKPAYGLRRILALLRKEMVVNRKKVHRIIKINGWQVFQKPNCHRPRVKSLPSRASTPNERWAIDTTHIFCGWNGWCHLTAIIDCCTRKILGWRFSLSGAAGALEEAIFSERPRCSDRIMVWYSEQRSS